MAEINHEEIFQEFCDWNPELASKVVAHAPWGSTSIVIWISNEMTYKVKRHAAGKFTMQTVTQDDIDKKFGYKD